jgi:hypothetical protein
VANSSTKYWKAIQTAAAFLNLMGMLVQNSIVLVE